MQPAHSKTVRIRSGLKEWLYRETAPLWIYAWAVVVACCFVAYLVPLSFLAGHSTVSDNGDIAQHVSGWWYYARDSWHFPLLHTSRLDHPDGVSIAFTDSIPLAALLFKSLLTLFPGLFPEHFHYFGWWVGFVFLAQAVSATFLIRALGAKSILAMVVAVGFAITWPVLHARYHHTALMTQSIIIFALALYFLGQQATWTSRRVSAAFVGLNLAALTIHPYYLAFTASFFIAFLVDRAIKGESWLLQLKRLLILFAALGVVIWLLGYTRHSSYDALGYGDNGYGNDFFLDLLAPFCGGGKLIACGAGPVYVFPYHEGFNYLGAGLLFLIPFAILFNWRSLPAIPRQSPALALLMAGFLLYALSNRVRFNDVELFSYPLPAMLEPLTGTFRAAGRFFWPVSLFLLFITLASLLKKKTWLVALLLVSALVLQIKDVKPLLHHIQAESAKPSQLRFADWAELMTRVDKVISYPIHECEPLHYQHNIWVMQLAGYYGKLINSGYTARGHKSCEADNLALQQPLVPRQLYILSSGAYSNTPFTPKFIFPEPFQQAMARGECVRRLDDMLCLPGSTPDFWQNLPLAASPIKLIDHGRHWGPAEFSTNIGTTVGKGFEQRLIPKNKSEAGWLSFGPFVFLPAGTYRFTIDYVSQALPAEHVGDWDVTLENTKIFASGQLTGTSGQPRRMEGILNIDTTDAGKPLEIRTNYLARGDLQLISSSLQKIP
jgi:hypothetical protein